MNKEKLLKLSESFTDVEQQIYELGSQLHKLSCQLENIRYSIIEVLKEENETSGAFVDDKQPVRKVSKVRSKKTSVALEVDQEPVSPIKMPDVVNSVSDPPQVHEMNAIEHTSQRSQVPICDIPVPLGEPIKVRYCSMVISNEFEFSDTESSKSIRSIYVIEQMTDTLARFYPIADKAQHLIQKRVELVDPICVAGWDLKPSDFIITEDAYGILQLNASGRWNIVKQCFLLH